MAAKSGDPDAAVRIANRLVSEEVLSALGRVTNPATVILPVTALEIGGFNAIPDAMAHIIAAKLGCRLDGGVIIQSNRVAHTRASGWHRLVMPATFEGARAGGATYVLVDDHVGFGGTLASLRGHIEEFGGKVLAMTTLSETRDARRIAIRPQTLSMLRERHGQPLEELWRTVFGYGLDCLTEVEAGYLRRQLSIDVIRARMAEAAEQARRRGFSPVILG